MSASRLFPVLLTICSSVCPPIATAAEADARLPDGVVTAILQQINAFRTSLDQPDMPALLWDNDLADFAAHTASGCKMVHTSNAQRSQIANWVGHYAGENLAIGYRSGMRLSDGKDEGKLIQYFSQAIRGWWKEQADYDYADNRCTPGKMCGHYTQLAWRQTRKVGCGIALCDPLPDYGRLGYNLACNFMPGGNIVGQRPY